MQIIEFARDMQLWSEGRRCAKQQIGFVPTMGALHEGHLELCRRAKAENDSLVVSIFVNPIQFGAGEDLEKYPRPIERDRAMLESVGCDALFLPTARTMYGDDGENQTFVEVENLSLRWDGESRPGHFRGVTTVVAKLFNISKPHRAYFGEKDFQQLQVIRQMASDLNFDLEVIGCPIIREADGLALSSRNTYLNREDRQAAPIIHRALKSGQNAVHNGERNVEILENFMLQAFEIEPRIKVEYLAIVDNETLEPIRELDPKKPARALIAARAGSTRLIDNIPLGVNEFE